MSRVNAYQSAAKIKMNKRSASIGGPLSPQGSSFKPMRNPTWDNAEGLPKLKVTHK